MTYQEHSKKLDLAINSAIKLIPLLKTTQQIKEVQAMLDELKAELPVYSFKLNSGNLLPLSSSQCTGEST